MAAQIQPTQVSATTNTLDLHKGLCHPPKGCPSVRNRRLLAITLRSLVFWTQHIAFVSADGFRLELLLGRLNGHLLSIESPRRKTMKSLMLTGAAGILLAGGMAIAQTSPGSGPAAAGGNSNQTVATTSANASTPAKGANSFTMGEAKSHLEKNGFSSVSDLTKDTDGVWRGKAQKDGSATSVWLDYKGNVGATN
jgi:hypothetical protein